MRNSKKYIFNSVTLSYEEQIRSRRSRIVKYSCLFLASVAMTVLYVWIYTSVLGQDLPKTARLQRINDGWSAKVDLIDRHLDEYDEVLGALQMRDDEIYRSIFGVEPIPTSVREAGRGGTNRYEALEGYSHSEEIIEIAEKIDKFSSQLYVQSKSFDEIYEIAKTKEDMMKHVPAIMPVKRTTIYGISSHFGYRTDPFYKVNKMHSGIDFSGPKGSPIYATGDGVVEKTVKSKTGYGNNIIINHGYGYKTRYAHLNSINVKKGDKIKRGQKIGTLGNTGKSSGPHLHYEVIKNNVPVNPINFFYNDLTPEMYDKIIELSKTPHQSMD